MHDFNGARDYLRRHAVHDLMERCVQEIVLQRPADQASIHKCFSDTVRAVEERKATIAGVKTVFVIGLEKDLMKAVHDGVAGQGVTLMRVPKADSAASKTFASQAAQAASLNPVVAVGFPRTTTEAVLFESQYVCPKLVGDLEPSPGNDETPEFVESVNPVAEYYRALGKLVKVSAAPADVQKAVQGALQ